jgi:L-cysteate sulfo-lyase
LPTPLQELSNLSKRLRGPKIYIKRDDMTGLSMGGNKTRKLEYLMADALEHKSDCVVTGAGFQSNWCTQVSAAACKLKMRTILIKRGPEEDYDPIEYDGNHLLHFLMRAEMKIVVPENFQSAQELMVKELKSAGYHPYLLKATGSTPLGVVGYINAFLEILQQSIELGIKIDYIIHATGSGGTQAGLVIGAKSFSTPIKIIGSTTGSRSKEEAHANVSRIIDESLKFLRTDVKFDDNDVLVYDQYAGGGYGFMTDKKAEAIQIMAETEGLFLDPVYTGSAMACLVDLCEQGFFKPRDVVVFLHTGGSAAVFPYKAALKAHGLGEALPWKVPPWHPSSRGNIEVP